MAESSLSQPKSGKQKGFTDPDMEAAQQLIQLSEEDDDNNKKTDEEIDQNQSEITSSKIEQIFGKEKESLRPRKRKFRSISSIYSRTRRIDVRELGKKLRC